ncbi:hypothetical protein J6590_102257 [Homalodisca vitripennis]|nr:hypothetical protein J6590_102257 [Homalodisca vitripennis]
MSSKVKSESWNSTLEEPIWKSDTMKILRDIGTAIQTKMQRDVWITNYKKNKDLLARSVYNAFPDTRVYVNEHLSPDNKIFLVSPSSPDADGSISIMINEEEIPNTTPNNEVQAIFQTTNELLTEHIETQPISTILQTREAEPEDKTQGYVDVIPKECTSKEVHSEENHKPSTSKQCVSEFSQNTNKSRECVPKKLNLPTTSAQSNQENVRPKRKCKTDNEATGDLFSDDPNSENDYDVDDSDEDPNYEPKNDLNFPKKQTISNKIFNIPRRNKVVVNTKEKEPEIFEENDNVFEFLEQNNTDLQKKKGKKSHEDFLDFKDLWANIGCNSTVNVSGCTVAMNDIKIIKVEKDSPFKIKYKTTYDDTVDFQEIFIQQIDIEENEDLFGDNKKSHTKKKTRSSKKKQQPRFPGSTTPHVERSHAAKNNIRKTSVRDVGSPLMARLWETSSVLGGHTCRPKISTGQSGLRTPGVRHGRGGSASSGKGNHHHSI